MIEALLHAERLLVHGQVDQAERIYANAIEQDPNNAIAMVGLARVALERGDDRLALERARAALALDPQNPAALRLETRMAEVLGVRDAPAAPPQPEQPEQPEQPAAVDYARPSERVIFTRNPSMADHQRMDEQRVAGDPGPDLQDEEQPRPERRPGLLRRLLGG
ncbi:hypothetical protein BH24CHL5_BH24CHL5_07760 [soil metagenome]